MGGCKQLKAINKIGWLKDDEFRVYLTIEMNNEGG